MFEIPAVSDPLMLALSVCGGALLWGVLIVVKKTYLDRHNAPVDVVVIATLLGAAVMCLSVEAVTFSAGITTMNMSALWLPLLVTATLNVGIQYWGVLALKKEDASIVGPLSATMPFWVIGLSFFILGEYPTKWGIVGIVTIGLGAYLIGLAPGKVALPEGLAKFVPERSRSTVAYLAGPWMRLWSSAGARLALLTAVLGAISVNFDKLAVLASSPMIQTSGAFIFVVLFVYSWSKGSGRWTTLDRTKFWPLFKWGLVLGVSNILMNSGYYFGLASYVGSLKRTQILWVVLLSWLILKEKNIPMKFVAALLILLGSVAIMF